MLTPPSLPSPAVGASLRALGCALIAANTAFAADAMRKSYDIAAGDAAVTLKRMVDQSNDQIFYLVDAVRGIKTNAVKGDLTVREALDRMVANTSLTIVQDEKTGALYVARAASRPPSEPPPSDAPDAKPNNAARRPLGRLGAFLALLTAGSAAPAHAQAPDVPPEPEGAVELSPFEVNTSRSQGYRTIEANTGTIIAVERDRIPFQTSVITSELIKDLQIDNPADLAQTISGVSKNINPGIADEAGQGTLSFMVRGFSSTPLYNGFQTGGRVLGVDNIGRVEVSKGPNSVLYGQSPGGGIINVIPKMPRFDRSFFNTSAGIGTNGWYRGSFELGGPLKSGDDANSDRSEMAFRVGGGYLEYEREQVFFDSKTYNLNAAFSWKPVKGLHVDFQAEFIDFDEVPSRTAAFVTLGSGPARVVDQYNRLRHDRNFSYNGPYSRNKRENAIATTYVTADLAESLTLRVGGYASTQSADTNGIMNAFGLSTSESANVGYTINDSTDKSWAYKVDLLHQLHLRGFSLNSLVGYEEHFDDGSYSVLETDPTLVPLVVTIPFSRATVKGDWPAPPARNLYTRLSAQGGSEIQWSNLRFTQYGETPNGRGSLLWGVAYGEGESTAINDLNRTQSTNDGDEVTYTAGASWKVYEDEEKFLNRVTLFANYATSFQIQGGNAQDPEIFQGFSTVEELEDFIDALPANTIDPQTGDGYEAGFRLEMLKKKLAVSVSYFDQSRENIARTFLVRASSVPGVTDERVLAFYQLASGEENAKGVDISVYWQPVRNLSLTADAMFSNGRVVSNVESPTEEGLGLVRSPENTFFFWGKYDFKNGPLSGLTVGLGASYRSATRVQPNLNDRYRVSDEYWVARAMIGYRYRLFNRQHAITLNAENLFDEEFVDEANFLSEPLLLRLMYSIDW